MGVKVGFRVARMQAVGFRRLPTSRTTAWQRSITSREKAPKCIFKGFGAQRLSKIEGLA